MGCQSTRSLVSVGGTDGCVSGLLLLLFFLASCGDTPSSNWTGTVDTLPDGAVRVASPATGLWTDTTRWRLEEDLRLGSVESSGAEQFGEITDLAVDAFGRIWVAEGQAQEIRVFGPDGSWVRTVGREGQGPGEFLGPDALRWGPEGRLWVVDQGNARVSVFDTAGNYLSGYVRPVTSGGMPWPGEIMEDGTIVDLTVVSTDDALTSRLVRWDTSGAVLDTLPLPSFERRLWVAERENAMAQTPVPYTPSLSWELQPNGVLWFGTGESYRLVARQLEGGDTIRVVERAYDPVPVTAAEKDSAMTGLDWLRQQGGRPDRDDIPDERPAFRNLFVDDIGRLWVRPSVAADSLRMRRFDVFDSDGRYLGPVDSPVMLRTNPRMVFRDGRLYGVTVDKLNVPYVVRLRIERL